MWAGCSKFQQSEKKQNNKGEIMKGKTIKEVNSGYWIKWKIRNTVYLRWIKT